MVDGIQGRGREVRRCATRPRSRATIGSMLLSLVVGLAVGAAADASAQPQRASAQPQWIVFAARPPGFGVEQLYRITPSGRGLKQLTKGAYASSAPAFAPNGKKIAFAELGAGIFSMNVDGTGVRRLTNNGRDSFPAWSPDGNQIAYIRPDANGWRVHVMSASGAGERVLRLAPPAGRPTWSRRGLLIPTEGDLARIDPTSGKVYQRFGATIDAVVGMTETSVSPDLRTITFVGAGPQDPGDKDCGEGVACPRFALYVESLGKNKGPRILARDAGPASFSNDGKRLAFVAKNRIVLRLLANGSSKSIKTGNVLPTVSTPPVWQPR
jgi:Tol biopolymer transport system component